MCRARLVKSTRLLLALLDIFDDPHYIAFTLTGFVTTRDRKMLDPLGVYELAVRLRTRFLPELFCASGSEKRRTTAEEEADERRERARRRAKERARQRAYERN